MKEQTLSALTVLLHQAHALLVEMELSILAEHLINDDDGFDNVYFALACMVTVIRRKNDSSPNSLRALSCFEVLESIHEVLDTYVVTPEDAFNVN